MNKVIYVRLGKTDTDLLYLYSAIKGGLGRVCKSAILDFFDYVDEKGFPTKFELPGFSNTREKETTVFKMTFSENESKCIEKLLSMAEGNRSNFIKALLRMYAGKRLVNLCRQKMFNKNKKEEEIKDTEFIEPIMHEDIVKNNFVKQETKSGSIFKPEEF